MAAPDLRSPDAIARAVDEAADHYRQGRLDAADKICTRVLKAAPGWFDALHLAGLVKLDSGKAAAAQALLARALKLNPGSAPVLANLGRALFALNRDDDAMASLDQGKSPPLPRRAPGRTRRPRAISCERCRAE